MPPYIENSTIPSARGNHAKKRDGCRKSKREAAQRGLKPRREKKGLSRKSEGVISKRPQPKAERPDRREEHIVGANLEYQDGGNPEVKEDNEAGEQSTCNKTRGAFPSARDPS